MVSCKIACEDVNDHSINHSTIFTKTSPDSIDHNLGGSPSDFKFSDTKVISYLIVLRSPEGMLSLSWVSELFRHDIGQFDSPRMKPCKSANYFIPPFQLGKFIVIVTKNIFIICDKSY